MLKRLCKRALVTALSLLFVLSGMIQPAQAASTYTALTVPTVTSSGQGPLGLVVIDVPEVAALCPGDVVTISLPSQVTMFNGTTNNNTVDPKVVFDWGTGLLTMNSATNQPVAPSWSPGVVENVSVVALSLNNQQQPNPFYAANTFVAYPATSNSFEIKILPELNGTFGPGRLIVRFNNLRYESVSGDITAIFMSPPSSGFTCGSVVIAKAVNKSTIAVIDNVANITQVGGSIGNILVVENMPCTIASDEQLKFTLPDGFIWDPSVASVIPGWGFEGTTWTMDTIDSGRTIRIIAPSSLSPSTTGRIILAGARILVNPNVAIPGEVKCHVSSNLGGVTVQDIIVAKYNVSSGGGGGGCPVVIGCAGIVIANDQPTAYPLTEAMPTNVDCIGIAFNVPMDPQSVEVPGSIQLISDNQTVSGTVYYNHACFTRPSGWSPYFAHLHLASPLQPGTAYTLIVTPNAKGQDLTPLDQDGNCNNGNQGYYLNFTTDGISPVCFGLAPWQATIWKDANSDVDLDLNMEVLLHDLSTGQTVLGVHDEIAFVPEIIEVIDVTCPDNTFLNPVLSTFTDVNNIEGKVYSI